MPEGRVSEPSGCKITRARSELVRCLAKPTTMNRWNIPDWLEREVLERDRSCVYCGVAFTGREASRVHRPSWEHITNDTRIITRENIARCCIGCNSSKGNRNLSEWLMSPYCAARGITGESVALVVQSYLASNS